MRSHYCWGIRSQDAIAMIADKMFRFDLLDKPLAYAMLVSYVLLCAAAEYVTASKKCQTCIEEKHMQVL